MIVTPAMPCAKTSRRENTLVAGCMNNSRTGGACKNTTPVRQKQKESPSRNTVAFCDGAVIPRAMACQRQQSRPNFVKVHHCSRNIWPAVNSAFYYPGRHMDTMLSAKHTSHPIERALQVSACSHFGLTRHGFFLALACNCVRR